MEYSRPSLERPFLPTENCGPTLKDSCVELQVLVTTLVSQGRWSLIEVVFQDKFRCIEDMGSDDGGLSRQVILYEGRVYYISSIQLTVCVRLKPSRVSNNAPRVPVSSWEGGWGDPETAVIRSHTRCDGTLSLLCSLSNRITPSLEPRCRNIGHSSCMTSLFIADWLKKTCVPNTMYSSVVRAA